MRLRQLTVATFALSTIASPFIAQPQTDKVEKLTPSPLEIRLSELPHWEKNCLKVSVDRINHSSTALFLPVKGLFIATSVSEATDTGNKLEERWINIFGFSDIGIWDATPIAVGATVHEEKCLYPEVAVVSLHAQSRRLIPLRGRLKFDATYFLTEKDWQNDKKNHEEMFQTKPAKWDLDKIAREGPKLVSVLTAIPCREADCKLSCNAPPVVLKDENRVIPDVFAFEPDWGTRGDKISNDLAREFPLCPGRTAAPH